MQKGFASLEIILVALIISLTVTVAVPNAARLVDRAALDYEQKRLYSELHLLRTFDRTATVSDIGTSMVKKFLAFKNKNVETYAALKFDRNANTYQILRDDKIFREPHKLDYGVTFAKETDVPDNILFDSTGSSNVKSKSVVLTSRRGRKVKIVFDSVGRIRGGK